MWHPWNQLDASTRDRAFAVAAPIALALFATILALDEPLRAAGNTMISLQLAGDRATADAILVSWGETGRVLAAFQLGFDYLFIVAFTAALSLGCVAAGQWCAKWSRLLAALGPWLAWAAVAVGVLDAVEDYFLLRGLAGTGGDWWPVMAWRCAAPKFALVAPVLIYIGIGLAARIFGGRTPR